RGKSGLAPRLTALELVVATRQGGPEHKRYVAKPRSEPGEPFQESKAGHDRQADIRQHEVGLIFEDGSEALATVMGDGDVVAALRQFLGDQGRSFPVVFDAEDFFSRFRHWRLLAVYPAEAPAAAILGYFWPRNE